MRVVLGMCMCVYRGGQKQLYNCVCGKSHAGYGYYNNFINSVFCVLTTVNLLLPTPVYNVWCGYVMCDAVWYV